MSKLRFPTVLLAFAALANFATVQAQETQTQTQTQPRPAQQNQTLRTQQTPAQQQLNQRPERSATGTDRNQQQGVTVKQALIKKLQKGNEAEIELATIAQKKSDNPELKKLAKTLIDDHTASNEKLGKLDSKQTDSGQRAGSQVSTASAVDQSQLQANSAHNKLVPHELCEIMDQACDNSLKMTKEMLQNHEGQDFEMAFLGQQCVAHVQMIAELKAIQNAGPQELQEFAKEAVTKTEKHLEEAKRIAKKLEDDRRNKS